MLFVMFLAAVISIHAPLRERLYAVLQNEGRRYFNPRSLTGATCVMPQLWLPRTYFNPRSLTGATLASLRQKPLLRFQSTLPYGSDSIKTNYFSINLSQAFFANRLNSNTQEFYFDVRKLLVSHSSPGCEPKLNYMFHITSHRIILHYFSSCQSICK